MHSKMGCLKKQNGYTLAELLVVISIIGMLLTLAIPSYHSAREQAALLKIRNDLCQIDSGLTSYEIIYGTAESITLSELSRLGLIDSNLRPPVKGLGHNLSSKQYEIDQNLRRAFLQLDADSRFYSNSRP